MQRTITHNLIAGLILPVAAPLFADPITSEEAVSIALASHPGIEAAAQSVEASEAEGRLADSGYLPRLDLEEHLVRSTDPVFVFGSKLRQESFSAADFDLDALNTPDALTNSATRLVLRQNVWDAGRTRLGMRAAKLGVEAATASRGRTEQQVAFGALAAFWDLVLAGEMVRVTEDAEAAARANLDLARERVDAGLAVPSDRMSAEVRLAETQALRISAEGGLEVAQASLLRALGLDEGGPFDPVVPADLPLPADETAEQRIEEALSQRSDLASLRHRVGQAEVGLKAARHRRHPDVGLGAHYEWNGDTLFGSDGSNWGVGIALTLPLFDGTETGARVARARTGVAGLEARSRELAQGIRLEVRAAWVERESARRRLDVAEAALERSGEALRIVRERYGEGMAVLVEMLAAEAAHTRAEMNRAVAEADVWLAEARLDLASGRLHPAAAAAGGS